MGFLPFILILVILYFLMIRPQMKRQKEQSAMLASLRKNDEVVTSGGMHGKIVHESDKEPTIQLQIAKGIIVTVERSSVARKSASGSSGSKESKPAGLIKSADQRSGGGERSTESGQSSRESAANVTPSSQSKKRRTGGGRRRRPPKQRDQSSS